MLTIRRRGPIVDRSAAAAIVTAVSLVGPGAGASRAGSGAGARLGRPLVVSAIGLMIVIAGKITLGRSFGLVPANRGVVMRGALQVRSASDLRRLPAHPRRFACAHPTAWNISLLLVADAALIMRALYEERVLETDGLYQTYCRRVAWHVVPGLF